MLAGRKERVPDPLAGRTGREQLEATRRTAVGLVTHPHQRPRYAQQTARCPGHEAERAAADREAAAGTDERLVGLADLLLACPTPGTGDQLEEPAEEPGDHSEGGGDEDVAEVLGREVLVHHEEGPREHRRAEGIDHRRGEAVAEPREQEACEDEERGEDADLDRGEPEPMARLQPLVFLADWCLGDIHLQEVLPQFLGDRRLPLLMVRDRFGELLVALLVSEEHPLALRQGLLLLLRQARLLLEAHPLQFEQLAERFLGGGGTVAEDLPAAFFVLEFALDPGLLLFEPGGRGRHHRIEPVAAEPTPVRPGETANVLENESQRPEEEERQRQGEDRDQPALPPRPAGLRLDSLHVRHGRISVSLIVPLPGDPRAVRLMSVPHRCRGTSGESPSDCPPSTAENGPSSVSLRPLPRRYDCVSDPLPPPFNHGIP